MSNKKVIFHDLGLIDYKTCWDFQTKLFDETVQQKIVNRKTPSSAKKTTNHLIFCQHPHVYTLGKSGSMSNLLLNEDQLNKKNISAGSTKSIQEISTKNNISKVDAEILSMYVRGLYCPETF